MGHKDCGISILGDAQNTAGYYPQTCDLALKLVLPWAWAWTRDLQEVPSSLNYSTDGSEMCFCTKLSSVGVFFSSHPWIWTLHLSLLLKLSIRPAYSVPFCFSKTRNKSVCPGGRAQLWGPQSARRGEQGPTAAPTRVPVTPRKRTVMPSPHFWSPASEECTVQVYSEKWQL